MKKIIGIYIILSVESFLLAGAGMEAYLVDLNENPKSFDDLGVLIGVAFSLFIGLLILIDYVKNKFKS